MQTTLPPSIARSCTPSATFTASAAAVRTSRWPDPARAARLEVDGVGAAPGGDRRRHRHGDRVEVDRAAARPRLVGLRDRARQHVLAARFHGSRRHAGVPGEVQQGAGRGELRQAEEEGKCHRNEGGAGEHAISGSARASRHGSLVLGRPRPAGASRTPEIENPRIAGVFRSRPVSRILSRVTILLCGLPGSSAGRLGGACSPCTGRGLASRRVATALVGSYPTVSPLPSASPENRCRRSPFCATFRRLSPPGSPQRPALRCPDFPRATRARGHPACTSNCSRGCAASP